MERNNEEFRKYLKNKFGKVADYLLEEESLELKTGSDEELYNLKGNHEENNREQVKRHTEDQFSEFSSQTKWDGDSFPGWAFDFPGWIGNLDIKKDIPARDIMVIGLEPHIQWRFYQVTYGFRKPHPDYFKDKEQLTDNKNLHTNLKALFGSKNESAEDFYKQFYVTDMCFFAPKGNANLIGQVKPKWGDVRAQVAQKLLKEEIEFIAPKIIISSGLVIADFVDNKILKKIAHPIEWISPKDFWNEPGATKNLPFISLFGQGETEEGEPKPRFIHIGVPHLASGLTQHFWTDDNRKELRDRLSEFMEAHGITL